MSTITITFGEQAENHVGMQKIGTLADDGFTLDELKSAREKFEELGLECELIDLHYAATQTPAYVLVVRDAVDKLLAFTNRTADDLFDEQTALDHDKKAKMYGRVVDKHARHNLCFDDVAQEPDYLNGKGRVVAFKDVPCTRHLQQILPDFLGEKARDLRAEGNYYYDVNKCGIGFHGDTERKRVIAIRLGNTVPLEYQWYYQGKAIGKRIRLTLEHGDLYVMSEKATGFDWKKKTIPTLRHAAGCEKFLR